MLFSPCSGPGLRGRLIGTLAVLVLIAASSGALTAAARAAGNASSAAGFIEGAQNADGGFPVHRGQASDPATTLWATVALLAAGKNPQDEKVNNGATAEGYLAGHLSAYHGVEDLALLAIIQAASGAPAARYGNPAAALRAGLTVQAISSDPGGAALGAIGLLALRANGPARQTATALLSDQQTALPDSRSDGGWGPRGDPQSAPTALALEALAETGVASNGSQAVSNGIAYLHRAQSGDGSIATSVAAGTSFGGDVAATAFTIQALAALHHPMLATSSHQSIRYGLASYQQLSTGGLSTYGAYDTADPPSVLQTAQAYPAFDGVAFPLPYVAPVPVAPKHASATAPNRASVGAASNGVSANAAAGTRTVAAYRGASAAGSAKAKAGRAAAGSGTHVSGQVVGASTAPKLATRSGRAPGKNLVPLYLALGLVGIGALGAAADRRRPSRTQRSSVAVAVQAGSDVLALARRRRAFAPAAIALVGAALIATPSVTGMWSRAPQGAKLMRAFSPYMRTARLATLQTDVSTLNGAFMQASLKAPALEFPRSADRGLRFAAASPQFEGYSERWPSVDHRFQNLLGTIGANRSNYRAVAALPSFDAFPWLLVAPGALLVLLGAAALVRPTAWRRVRVLAAGFGACLVIAPLALGLFSAGAKGSRMVSAFQGVESRVRVTALQNDFSSLVVGQATLSTELPARVVAQIPAIGALNRHWVGILGDFTPMLGVMSDNVANYRAVAALPDLAALPWLFAVPGLVLAAIALLTALGTPSLIRRRRPATEPQLQARSTA